MSAEKDGREGTLDLGKIQMLLVSVVVLVTYGAAMTRLLDSGETVEALPQLSGGVISLLAISQEGYLLAKSVRGGAPAPPG
ncbi:MAG: hypothetical protein FJZ92_11960 [Chloroflexi bacterium]|nr:hypothetical protein [Chloroflexota bacterium]